MLYRVFPPSIRKRAGAFGNKVGDGSFLRVMSHTLPENVRSFCAQNKYKLLTSLFNVAKIKIENRRKVIDLNQAALLTNCSNLSEV